MSDPPDHAGYRALCAPLFTPNRIAELRPSVTELTGQLIDEMKPRGGCEFMADFALQMPIIVFLRLVDLPASDRERLRSEEHTYELQSLMRNSYAIFCLKK